MRVKQINLYQFDELSDGAKEKAREWWRQLLDTSDYADTVLDDAERIAEIIGISLRTRTYRTVGGKEGTEPCIFWSGFSSQGDGVCFEGSYAHAAQCVKKLKAYAPTDTALHAIAAELVSIQKRYAYKAELRIEHRGSYCHSYTMQFEDVGERALVQEDYDAMREALRRFADWIYSQLMAAYDYAVSDENVDECIRINEYEFTADGRRACLNS